MFGFESLKERSKASSVDPEAEKVLLDAEGEEQSGFHKSVPAANAEVFVDSIPAEGDGLAHGLNNNDLPVVTEVGMEEFHAGLGLEPKTADKGVDFNSLSLADQRAAMEAAQQKAHQSVSQEPLLFDDEKSVATAEGILRAKELLDRAERELEESHQQYSQMVTDQLGKGTTPEIQQKITGLKNDIMRREKNLAIMQATYKKATQPIQ